MQLAILLIALAQLPSYPVVTPRMPVAIVSLPSYPIVSPIPVELVQPGQAPTPISEVRRVLKLLNPQPNERFVDYGCGDGRWLVEAAKTYNCRAVGIEIDSIQAEKARRAVADARLTDKVQIIVGDATTTDVEAQVGIAYLYPDVLDRLKPKLLKLKRFATYMHKVDGVDMQQSGDAWMWRAAPVYTTPYALYDGQVYTGRVCNSPYCSMCNAIARQLGQ